MGKAWKFGDKVNTDIIIPARFNITIDPDELAKKVFCEIKPEYALNVKPGDIIVAGENFGCGSSREHAPIAIKGSKVKCVIAKSFARIFFRNCINIGLPILECDMHGETNEWDEIEVDLGKGIIRNITADKTYQAKSLPDFVLKIVDEGGIVNFLKKHDIEELA